MSSHDSMGLVFECLSKGAADFLVKPVRKNELKNLWQHVWKRCPSSSGSGSESGTRTRKSVKSKSRDKFDNSGSYDGATNESNGLEDVGDGSEDGSDAQSSWIKQAVEVGRSKAMSPIDQLADCPDSTSAQDTCSNAEAAANKMLQNIIARKAHKGKEHDTVAKGKSFQTVIPRNSESQSENPNESHLELQGAEQLSLLGIDCNINNNQVDKGQFKTTGECLFSKHKDVTANTSSPWIDCKVSECTREVANISEIYNNVTDKSKKPNKELRLKRFRGVQEIGRTVQDDRCVLRHSEQSAFSRYNTSSNVFKTPNGITASSSVVDCSVESATRETAFDLQAHSIDHLLCQSSKGSSNNIDMGSTTKKLSTFLPIVKDKSEATSTINPSALRPVKNDLTYAQQKVNLVIHNDMQTTENLAVARGSNEDALHPYHHHHHCHNFPNLEQQPPSDHNELSLKKLTAYSPCSGSSNVFGEPMDANLRNYSLNGHASGSKHGSNGQNGSSTALGFNAEGDLGQAGKNGSEDASGSGSGNKRGENKLALQKDALNKICQKRKER
ncbi:unnamed protein product [Fraxinus pennsylvanica]|uniref:Response regulatory domain-containing protein n=1 Tax=Fraxinus pennsylvanica TaxID=56036 RepID=A0AAD1ZG08_9LAMI|nr:unnamed protein product [Fraxinus pennsylvanica]